jgi:exodeoxyribonuclease VII large subunit
MLDNDKVLSVSELTSLVKEILEGGFPEVTVEGEITNVRPASSGHLYFSLKDRSSMVQAVMFRYKSRALGFEPQDGMLVRARGGITVYAARGQYQILVERLELAGEGDLLAQIEERKRRLAAEGLFDESRKRPLPRFPSRVAVITSATGAAIRDIINVVTRRNSGLDLVLLPAAVQGEAAPADLVRQLKTANRYKLGDVIIIGRGGGSLEDLLAFSDESVVRAVAASKLPVISAVGHEIDWALTDFAADLRAPTPSAAAELVTESRLALAREVEQFEGELETAMRSRLDHARLLLGRFEPASVEGQFMRIFTPALRRYDDAKDELARGLKEGLAARRHRLELAMTGLEAASPDAILARGYAVVRKSGSKKAIRDSGELKAGMAVDIRFARGGAKAAIEETKADETAI